ncbi:tetrahydrofolate dehydrogenase/cyclohydrolase catalytic domain-containing protein [Clostridium vincentii]|uniref:Bifunctional protein FolD n=1 Tax=Clostridium vincentii TaxID=52704 RepID=A0A2T0BGH5_9CLOT|nr:tetrahydrofolate dehydrogenase/cyclohydrolase catalytic domain-containing protein [Clostridium vincentii]PRR82964.1 Bifunctional protein FolD protein [Clostridium vincentii]
MGQVINGKEIAINIKEEIKSYVLKRSEDGKNIPKIASILVGNDGGSIYYMNNQEKVARSLGLLFNKIVLESNIKEEELIDLIEELNKDNEVQGIILQVPMPKHINENRVINAICPNKDIDCLTTESQGRLYMGVEGFLPCTPNSVITLLRSLNVNLEGKEVVVLGRSNVVGKPVAQLLLNENATVTICHSRTKNLKEVCKRADILVVAIGRPKFVDDSYVKDGAIVIDVGTSSVEGKITGDVDFEKVINKAAFVTPVPGGVGALTTTLLLKNVCEALKKNED